MIDAHVHVWDLQAREQVWIPADSPMRRTFEVAELEQTGRAAGVDRAILVQVINSADETADFLAIAAGEPFVAGVVGWVDLAAANVADELHRMLETGFLSGIRHQALAEDDPAGWFTSGAVANGLRALERVGLPCDLILRPEHYHAATAVARAHPSLQFVLNHLGKAPIAGGELDPWAAQLSALAALPNMNCKISGVHTIAAPGADFAQIAPFIEIALDAFGSGRVIFGSDWPVCSQSADYGTVVATARRACAALTDPEREAVLGGNAVRLYLP